MTPTLNEVEKALVYISQEGRSAGKRIEYEMKEIAGWQRVSLDTIRSLAETIKTTGDKIAKDILIDELKVRKAVYRYDLKKKMKRRRLLKLAKNLFSLIGHTERIKNGVKYRDTEGYWHPLYRVELLETFSTFGDLQDYKGQSHTWFESKGQLYPWFVIRTPFMLYGNPIDLFGKYVPEWMCKALNKNGYTLYGVRIVMHRDK